MKTTFAYPRMNVKCPHCEGVSSFQVKKTIFTQGQIVKCPDCQEKFKVEEGK